MRNTCGLDVITVKNYGTVLLIGFAVFLLLVANAMLGFILIGQSKEAMKTLIQSRMLDISNTAADMLDGDKLKALKKEDKGTLNYQEINDTLAHFQDNIDLSYIYCIKIVGEKEFVFSVDPTILDPGEFGEPIVYTDALYAASKGTPTVDKEPYEDAWGRFYSAYTPVFDSEGNVAGIVAVDFSAKWYDEQVEKQSRTIAVCMLISLLLCIVLVLFVTSRLRQHIKDITGDLRLALDVAEDASKAKTVFLSNMSHEIRTPMNAIIGMDHIALNTPNLPEATKEQLVKIDASARHLLGIINDILDISRIESGKTTLNNKLFSIDKLLEQVNAIVGSQCEEKNLHYECKIMGELEKTYIGDDMKLRQSLINILGNAVKFTPENGSVTLTVEETARTESKTALRFTVADTGIGISEEYLPKIFEAFSQENSGKEIRYGSTGLGMAITKRLIDLMNGDISVESKKGEGTTFFVTITLDRDIKKQEDLLGELGAKEDEEAALLKADLSGVRILLAEDMPVNAEIAVEILKMRGMTTEWVENGQRALEKFAESERGYYDAILMDMRMPVMDGIEATKKIRELTRPDAKTIPIIALTANAFDEDVRESIKSGMSAHLSKPIEPDEIYRTLARLIKR